MDIKRKKIVINLGIFGTHGIDRAALEIMHVLCKLEHDVYLHLIYERVEKSFLYSQIPSSVKVITAMPLDSFWGLAHMNRYKSIWHKLLDSIGLIRMQSLIAKSVNSLAPDVIFDFDISLQKCIKRIQAPTIGTIHFNPKLIRGGKPTRLARMGQRLKHYKKVVLLCDEMLDQAKDLWPYALEKFFVIANPVNKASLYAQAKEKYFLPVNITSQQYFINVARLTGQKDISTLLKAYAIAKKSGVNWPLILIGDGDEKKVLQNLSRSLGVENDVFFLGHQNNPRPHVKDAGCFVLSSNNEGLPTVLIEAQILGCPIISTACSTGPKDILKGGTLGLLTPVGNPQSLAEAMIKMWASPDLRKKLSTEGIMSSEQYLPEKVAQAYLDLVVN